jgi:hypothetical protein
MRVTVHFVQRLHKSGLLLCQTVAEWKKSAAKRIWCMTYISAVANYGKLPVMYKPEFIEQHFVCDTQLATHDFSHNHQAMNGGIEDYARLALGRRDN